MSELHVHVHTTCAINTGKWIDYFGIIRRKQQNGKKLRKENVSCKIHDHSRTTKSTTELRKTNKLFTSMVKKTSSRKYMACTGKVLQTVYNIT